MAIHHVHKLWAPTFCLPRYVIMLDDNAQIPPFTESEKMTSHKRDDSSSTAILEIGRDAMLAEAQAIVRAADQIDHRFARAVQLIAESEGAVIVSGIGKSGHVAHKIAATFASTGTPAFFLHAAEAAHGDIGMCRNGDLALLISKSGATGELIALTSMLREREVPIIAITGAANSPLAISADVALDGSISREADLHNLAPSSSTAVAMALGDALAFAVMRIRRLKADELARNHPGGRIGYLFRVKVGDVMASGNRVAQVHGDDLLHSVLEQVTRSGLGCACVIDENGHLEGLITDGDIRRALQRSIDVEAARAADVMTRTPVTIEHSATLYQAMQLMENRPSQISVLPVIDGPRWVGLIRLHDIYQAGLL
jgi:arabinose-5-phosphate isomerase